jgi:hypothetical protein
LLVLQYLVLAVSKVNVKMVLTVNNVQHSAAHSLVKAQVALMIQIHVQYLWVLAVDLMILVMKQMQQHVHKVAILTTVMAHIVLTLIVLQRYLVTNAVVLLLLHLVQTRLTPRT